jgi:type II secretory pathway component PulF
MKTDEFAFFNQQLAAMLRGGIPLEGALRQLCAGMKTGALRAELQALEADLASGTPLKDAMARRQLPEFYKRMVELGTRSNDLPGVLTMLADHYHRGHVLWTRLKGLMVYPLIVIIVSLGLTFFLSTSFSRLLEVFILSTTDLASWRGGLDRFFIVAGVWIPPVVMALLAVLVIGAVSVPGTRAKLRWRLPAFREASLAQLASALALMLRNGTTLAESLALAEGIEAATPAAGALANWRRLVESGRGKPAQWPAPPKPIPPLFLWLVQTGGEDVAAGFQKAAEIYQARASYRIEMALYGALPVSILLLGQMVIWQLVPFMRSFTWFFQCLEGFE